MQWAEAVAGLASSSPGQCPHRPCTVLLHPFCIIVFILLNWRGIAAYAAMPLHPLVAHWHTLYHKHSHDTAGSATASVTSLERVGVAAKTKVVLACVDDQRATKDRVGPDERNLLVGNVDVGSARAVSLDVAEVADVTLGGSRASVVLAVGVEVAAGTGATRAHVSKLMDAAAKIPEGAGRQTRRSTRTRRSRWRW